MASVSNELPRMARGQHLAMATIMDGGIDLGGSDGAMSQKMLDIADIDTLLEEKGRHRMAEHVRGKVESKPGPVGVVTEHRADGLL
jgi:hypothetical protein